MLGINDFCHECKKNQYSFRDTFYIVWRSKKEIIKELIYCKDCYEKLFNDRLTTNWQWQCKKCDKLISTFSDYVRIDNGYVSYIGYCHECYNNLTGLKP